MKRTCFFLTILGVVCIATTASAAPIFGSHVEGERNNFALAPDTSGPITGAGGMGFDPTSTDVNGDYDRIYLVNRSDFNSRRGLYSVDAFNETYSSRIALAGASNNDLDKPGSVIVDGNGDAWVTFDGAPSIWKVTDPSGAVTETQIIGKYGGTEDDDPSSSAFVPAGFGGSFAVGQDIIVFDNGLQDNDVIAVSVIDVTNSTPAAPVATTVYSNNSSSNTSIRGDASSIDGYAYFTRTDIESADLDGTVRPFISRVNSSGALQRMFVDTAAIGVSVADFDKLDDALQVNPADGSVWLMVDDVDNQTHIVYRVDAIGATDEGSGDFLASLSQEIINTDAAGDEYSLTANGMAFSPDGRLLAIAQAGGTDRMHIYSLIPEPNSFALLSIAGLSLLRRRVA